MADTPDMSWLELFVAAVSYVSFRIFLALLAIAVVSGLVMWVA